LSKLSDEEMAALIEKDPVKALFILVEEAGGTMRLYDKPVTESELKAHAEQLADEKIKRLLCRETEKTKP